MLTAKEKDLEQELCRAKQRDPAGETEEALDAAIAGLKRNIYDLNAQVGCLPSLADPRDEGGHRASQRKVRGEPSQHRGLPDRHGWRARGPRGEPLWSGGASSPQTPLPSLNY